MARCLVAIAMLCMAACGSSSKDEPTPVPGPTPGPLPDPTADVVGRTMFIYMPWSGSETSSSRGLYDQFVQNIADVESAIVSSGTLGDRRVLVAIAPNFYALNLIEIKLSGTQCVRDTLYRYESPEWASQEWLTRLFSDVARVAPAQSYAMIVGSHGNGWLPAGSSPHRVRAFGGREATSQTTIETLSASIAASLIKSMEFICFDDCYMANAETAYELRNVTHYLIASTSEIMDYGLPYLQVWKHLINAPDYQAVCSEFLTYYSTYPLPYGALSVTDCTVMNDLATAMTALNRAVDLSTERVSGVQVLDGFNATVFYDMRDYVKKVCDDASLVAAVESALDRAVVARCCTERLYSVYLQKLDHTFAVADNCGLTISDCSTNISALVGKEDTAWWQATH